MDDFLTTYFIFLVLGVIVFLLFWGTVIYFVIRFFRSDTGLSTGQKLNIFAGLMRILSLGRGGSRDIMGSNAGSVAAGEGIDLNDNRS